MRTQRVYLIAAALIALALLGAGFMVYKNTGKSSMPSFSGGSSSGSPATPLPMFSPVGALPTPSSEPAQATPPATSTRARALSVRQAPPASPSAQPDEPATQALIDLPTEPTGAGLTEPQAEPTFAGLGSTPEGWSGGVSSSGLIGAGSGGGSGGGSAPMSFSSGGGGGGGVFVTINNSDTRNGLPRIPTTTTPVDEPRMVWLLLAGLGALAFKTRRNK